MSETIEVSSSIQRVEVYRSQALVTRRVHIETLGKRGRLDLLIPGLPPLTRDDSVRVCPPDRPGVRVLDLHLEWMLGKREGTVRTQGESVLRELMRRQVDLEVALERERKRLKFLESLVPESHPAIDMPEPLAFAEKHLLPAWMKHADYVVAQLLATRKRLRELLKKLRDVGDEITEGKNRLEQESRAELEALAMCRKAARLQLDMDWPESILNLEISYLVHGALWVPEYELRVFEERDQSELVLKALIAQHTGEDWTGAELTFSTADLNRSAELPELESWRIGKTQPPRASGWRPPPEGLESLFEAYDKGLRPVPPPPAPPPVELPSLPRLGAGEKAKEPLRRAGAEPPPAPPEANSIAEFAPEPSVPAYFPAPAAGAPPMQVQAAAAQESMMMKSRGLFSRSTRKSKALEFEKSEMEELDEFDSYAPGEEEREEGRLEAGVTASAEALSYQNLKMQGTSAPRGRGELKASSSGDRLMAQMAETSPDLAEALIDRSERFLLSAAQDQAAALKELALPRYAVNPGESAGNFAVRYPMESPGQVNADGQWHSLTLLRRQGAVRRLYRSVPLLDDKIYQMAIFENPLGVPLLAGPVQIYRGSDFVVTAPLTTTPPGKNLTINLGVEPRLTVARNLSFHESTEGLFKGGNALEHEVRIEVRSKMARPVRVEIFERVPYSRDEDIKIEIQKSSPEAESYDQSERGKPLHGGLKFQLDLQPMETRTCTLKYRIAIPGKQMLVGGNRRA